MKLLLLGSCWGIAIAFAIGGWGWLVAKVLRSDAADNMGLTLPLGMTFLIAIGGVLNALAIISPKVVILLLAVGICFGALRAWLGRPAHSSAPWKIRLARLQWTSKVAIGFVMGLVVLFYVGSVYSINFNEHDDLQGYALYPLKMLQAGGMGSDPFSERRLVTSLGGQSFLHTFVLAVLPVECLHLIDPGSCTLLLVAMIASKLSARGRLPHALLFVAIIALLDTGRANITSTMSGVVVLLGLFECLGIIEERPLVSNGAILGLVVSGACALKSTFIAPVAITTTVFFTLKILKDSRNRWLIGKTALMCLLICLLCLVPWMYSMRQSGGTWMYPILGKGYHGAAYGKFVDPRNAVPPLRVLVSILAATWNPLFLSSIALSCLSVLFLGWRSERIAIIMGTVLGLFTLGIGTSGVALERYMFPVLLPIVIYLGTKVIDPEARRRAVGRWESFDLAPLLVCVWLLGSGAAAAHSAMKGSVVNLHNAIVHQTLASVKEAQGIISAQSSVPSGGVILERISQPFLLDFGRNQIYIADYPGGASLPPGMPAKQGPEALSQYLVGASVQHVIYSYGDEARFTRKEYGDRLDPGFNPWLRSEAENAFDFQDSLTQLRKSRVRLYDDGMIVMLDLSRKFQLTSQGE